MTDAAHANSMYLVLDVVLARAAAVAANLAREHAIRAKRAPNALAEQRRDVVLHALKQSITQDTRQRRRVRDTACGHDRHLPSPHACVNARLMNAHVPRSRRA